MVATHERPFKVRTVPWSCRARLLWRQAIDAPGTVTVQGVAQPVVQAVGTALPELDHLWGNAHPAPMGRTRHLAVLVLLHEFGKAPIELLAAVDDPALWRRPRADTAAQ